MTSDGQRSAAVSGEAPAPTAGQAPTPQLRALVLCDLAPGAMPEIRDETQSVELVREHDRLVRELLSAHAGFEADKTDGFLALFERPIQAVAFALAYQRRIGELGRNLGLPLSGRVGIHVGDVVTWHNSKEDVELGARRLEVEGLAKPVAARLMHLAGPGQILLSSIALALAQRAEPELENTTGRVRWLHHGPYRFKGVPAPMIVHEVGEIGLAPLTPPRSDDKAVRETPWWRRPVALAVEAIALVAVVVIGLVLSGRSQPVIAFAERDWVVVGDLRNMTGDDSLTEALDVAFRISLEHSRHVNVLSDLKVRDTLRRMQREADAPLDRETGAEVALRDGARALILPTVAEIGGRVRVSAEVIDPHTQTTVYAESHDGVGIDSVLHSLDRVTGALRAKLGDTLKNIESEATPLPQVATANLEALKAYAQGIAAYGTGGFATAVGFYENALALDPDFALAHVGLARLYVGAGDLESARRHMHVAASMADRLSSRDALYVEAWISSFGPLQQLQDRWLTLTSLYPDYFAGYYNSALFYWQHGAAYAKGAERVSGAMSAMNPLEWGAYSLRGTLRLAQNDVQAALQDFEAADNRGFSGLGSMQAMAWLAAGHPERASERLERGSRYGLSSADVVRWLNSAVIAAHSGEIDSALAALSSGMAESASISSVQQRVFSGAALALQSVVAPTPLTGETLDGFCRSSIEALQPDSVSLQRAQFATLACAWLRARSGDGDGAKRAVDAVAAIAHEGFPAIQAMKSVAAAEILMLQGRAGEAVDLLRSQIGDSELYLLRAALVDATLADGRVEEAYDLSVRLTGERGRALGEWNSERMLVPFNAAHNSMELLRAAELAMQLGRAEESARHRAEFLERWAVSGASESVSERLRALE